MDEDVKFRWGFLLVGVLLALCLFWVNGEFGLRDSSCWIMVRGLHADILHLAAIYSLVLFSYGWIIMAIFILFFGFFGPMSMVKEEQR